MSAFTKQTPAESAALSAILEQNQGKPLRALTLAAKASGAFAGRATEDVVKNLKGGASYSQPVRLYSRAAFVGYKRGGPNSGNQYENVALVRIEGVRSKDDVDFYLGKRVAYIYKVRLPAAATRVCPCARRGALFAAARSPPLPLCLALLSHRPLPPPGKDVQARDEVPRDLGKGPPPPRQQRPRARDLQAEPSAEGAGRTASRHALPEPNLDVLNILLQCQPHPAARTRAPCGARDPRRQAARSALPPPSPPVLPPTLENAHPLVCVLFHEHVPW